MTNKEIDRLAEILARDAEMQQGEYTQNPTPQQRREDPPSIEPFAIFWLSILLAALAAVLTLLFS